MTLAIIVFSFAILIAGCVSKPVDVAAIPLQEMKVREGVNINEIARQIDSSRQHRGRVQVVLVEFTNGKNELTHSNNVANIAMNELKHAITQSGAELVDRGLVHKLQEEIRLIEITGKSEYREIALADIAIKGEITSTNYSSSFTQASSWTDDKGKVHHVPARCNYVGDTEALISFYYINPLSLKKTISVAGRERSSSDTTHSRCQLSQGEIANLLSEAAQNAINSEARAIKNSFSPTGYIDEYRRSNDGNTHIFRTTLSPKIGAAPGNHVKIWKDVIYTNQLGRQIHERSVVAEGKVIEAVGGSVDAWVKIDKGNEAGLVKLGDKVEVDFQGLHPTLGTIINTLENYLD